MKRRRNSLSLYSLFFATRFFCRNGWESGAKREIRGWRMAWACAIVTELNRLPISNSQFSFQFFMGDEGGWKLSPPCHSRNWYARISLTTSSRSSLIWLFSSSFWLIGTAGMYRPSPLETIYFSHPAFFLHPREIFSLSLSVTFSCERKLQKKTKKGCEIACMNLAPFVLSERHSSSSTQRWREAHCGSNGKDERRKMDNSCPPRKWETWIILKMESANFCRGSA